jgi:hypothetical protein
MRYARLTPNARGPLSLDPRRIYRVVGDGNVPGYVWIEAPGIGDQFLNPNRRCVRAASLEVWEEDDPPPGAPATPSST